MYAQSALLSHRPSPLSIAKSPLALLILLFCFAILASHPAYAQSTFGSVRGVAQDDSGAVLPDTQLTLHSLDENTDRTVKTGSDGSFTLENVKPGKYSVHAHHDGFAETVMNGVSVEARQDVRLTVALSVAAQTSTVEVSAAADQINSENAAIGDSKSNLQITQLPLNNRATTTSPLGALGLSPNVQQDSQGNIALGGASSSMVNFSVDGISTANVRQNGALQDAYPSQEGISAVKVTAFNNSAEFSQVGDVTFTTKNGTNTYHGSLFEYLQNQALDASPYGFSGKAPKKFNTFGGSLGGPISIPHLYDGHNKTFFFVDYEGNRRTTAVAQQLLVPTQAERNGDLTDLGTNLVIPQANISATAKALLELLPAPQCLGPERLQLRELPVDTCTNRRRRHPYRSDHHLQAVGLCTIQPQEHHIGLCECLSAQRRGQHSQPQPARLAHLHHHAEAAERVPLRLHECHHERRLSDLRRKRVAAARPSGRRHQPASDHECLPHLQLQRRHRTDADRPRQDRHNPVEDDAVQRQRDLHAGQAHPEGRHRHPQGTLLRRRALSSLRRLRLIHLPAELHRQCLRRLPRRRTHHALLRRLKP